MIAVFFLFVLIGGLAFGYKLAKSNSKKESPVVGNPTLKEPVIAVSPPQNNSYLEDKLWYEGELNFLFKFDERLISAFNLKDVIECVTEAAYNFLPIERTILLIWDKNTEKFTLANSKGWQQERGKEALSVGKESISGLVARNRDVMVVADLTKDMYLNKINKEPYLQKAFISAPLIYKNEVFGLLHVCDKKTGGAFTQRDVSVVMNIVRMGAISLQNARLYEEVSKRAAELKIAYDELKEMQDRLIQSEKLKAIGQLASGVAHEMRNPLGIIMQGTAYLEQISAQEKEIQETLSIIKESALRADKIVISLLDFSRAKKLELYPEDISSVLDNSLNLVKTELKGIQIIKEIPENMPKISIDKNKLTQVFINLFMNAVHAMPKGGKLTIRSFLKPPGEAGMRNRDQAFNPGQDALIIEIEDTGSGISEENLKRIFDPFFSTKGPGKGTGLGLSVSQNIIIMHKGLIEVTSQLNQGTKVAIALRITEEG